MSGYQLHHDLDALRHQLHRVQHQRTAAAELHANDGAGRCCTCWTRDGQRVTFPCRTYRALTGWGPLDSGLPSGRD